MPDALVKVGSIVVLLGGLIFVHELGHFLVAKLMRVKVIRFSIGFGPRLFGFTRGETEYRIAALPLGGYVKMAGDDPTEAPAPEDRGRGFLEQAPWKRLLIAVAGPAANLAFPLLVYVALTAARIGDPTAGPVLGTVLPGSPAEAAGLRPGDRVLSVAARGEPPREVRQFIDLRRYVAPHPGEPLVLEVQRGSERLPPITVTPATEEDSNVLETRRRGVIGIAPAYLPALVAPATPGAAGALEPFDLVVRAGGKPVRHAVDLEQALEAAACAPLDLEVLRERTVPLPGAALAARDPVTLSAVPTCAAGQRVIRLADPTISTFVAVVVPGSPAAQAGLRRGDAIRAVNGKPLPSLRSLSLPKEDVESGKPIRLDLADGRTVTVTPAKESVFDEVSGKHVQRSVVGFFPGRYAPVDDRALLVTEVPMRLGAVDVLALGYEELFQIARSMILSIVRIFTGDISPNHLGGVIMLFTVATDAAEQGWTVFLQMMAVVSINLALMNLLPIPVLDGGHIVQAMIESVTRRPLSIRTREIASIVGLVLLFMLMVFAFKNDIVRLMRPME